MRSVVVELLVRESSVERDCEQKRSFLCASLT